MNNNKLILHAIIMHKPFFKTKEQALNKAIEMFPNEHIKGFVRETSESWRVRVIPKTKFDETSYISKVLNNNITIVLGKLKDSAPPVATHYIDFNKIKKYKSSLPKTMV